MYKLLLTLSALLPLILSGAARAELPLGADAARAMGIELPAPFGLSWSHLDQSQPFAVTSLSLAGGGAALPATIRDLINEDVSTTYRADLWLLPFLNLYAMAGTTRSLSRGQATIPPGVVGPQGVSLAFRQRYEGDVAGVGMLLAMAGDNMFGTVDINYSETDIDISDDDAKATVITQRIGWNGRAGFWRGAIWVGAMFQDVQQTLQIDTQFMGVPVTAVIDQKAAKPWNALLGLSWTVNRHLWLAIEGGAVGREQWLGSAGLRF